MEPQLPQQADPLALPQQPQQGDKMIPRDKPEADPSVVANVKEWLEKIDEAKKYWKDVFDQMRAGTKFAHGQQWPEQSAKDDRYRANIVLRHINQRTASIYAKNPRVRVQRRKRLYTQVWDGSQEMLTNAMNSLMAAQDPAGSAAAVSAGAAPAPTMDPVMAKTIVDEATACKQKKDLYDRIGQTMEIVAQYSLDEPVPKFKTQAKQLVRRVLTCKVGFVKLGYQRQMEYGPDVEARMKDISDKLKEIDRIAADIADGEVQQSDAEAEQLRASLADLQARKEVVSREGLMFSFPKAWALIPDPEVTQLKGFVGAEWIVEEFILTPKKVQKIYNVDVGNNFTLHTPDGQKGDKRRKADKFCAVYEVHDIMNQMVFTVCAGYPTYLREPAEEAISLEQIHPYFALTFNDTETTGEDAQWSAYPPSDVELLTPMQMEYNRGREGLRVHRIANRPATVAAAGVFDTETKESFANHADHELIVTNLSKGEDINKALMPKPTVPIQKELYDVEHVFIDTQRVIGDQAANLGGTSGATATESSIAENSRVSTIQSCIDDLDEFLTDLMRASGQTLLLEMSEQTVKRIAGDGAAWPKFSQQEVQEELYLEVQAGSSGRPNKQGRLQAIEKTMPLLLQIPGIKPRKLADFVLREVDENMEVDEFLDDALPSITAMNVQAKPNLAPMPGNQAQGPAGQSNSPMPSESPGKTQHLGGSAPMPPSMPTGGPTG